MADNILSLALEIVADPTNAMKAIEEFRGQAKAAAADVQASNAATLSGAKQATEATNQLAAAQQHVAQVTEATRKTYAQLLAESGRTREEVTRIYRDAGNDAGRIKADVEGAFGVATAGAAQAKESVDNFSKSVRSNLVDLQALRRAFYSVFFFTGVAYIIPQVIELGKEIEHISLVLGGVSEAEQEVAQAAVEANQKQLESYRQLRSDQLQRLLLMDDLHARSVAQAQFEIANAKIAEQTFTQQRENLQEAIDLRRQQNEQARQFGPIVAAGTAIWNYFAETAEGTGKALVRAQEDEKKAALAIDQLRIQLKDATAAYDKAANSADKLGLAQQRLDDIIATSTAKLPPYIEQIDRLQKTMLMPAGKENQTLFAYAELNAQRLLEGLKPLEATAEQLGITFAKLGMGAATAPISLQIEAIKQLTEAQRLALPTERELQLANAELAREYPNLTAAERAEWAQIMLTSDAYRKHIDEAGRARASNAQLASSFNALAVQVRTAFSQMAGELTGWGGVGTRVFDQMFNAIARQIEIQHRQVAEHQIAEVSMATATLNALKQLAPVQAIAETAKAFAALGSFQYWSAAQHFASAALWGAVTAFQVASLAGAFAPGASGSAAVAGTSQAAGGAGGPSPALASGSASAAARESNQQQTVQVIFQGPVYGGNQGIKELVQHIGNAVRYNRLYLPASHTITGKALA